MLAAAISAGTGALSPAAAQTGPKVLEACRNTQKTIDASKLPDVWNPAKCPVKDMIIRDGATASVLPAPGESVHIEALGPSGSQQLTIARAKDGTVDLGKVGNEVNADKATPGDVSTLAVNNECSDSAYTKTGWRVEGKLAYSFNRTSTPRGVGGRIVAERAIRRAAGNISSTRNRCRLGDRVSARTAYTGSTRAKAQINRYGVCKGNDSKSVVSFGGMSKPGPLASACTWYWPQTGYDKVASSDIKLDTRYRWTTRPGARSCQNRYDVESTVTHEFGHTFGLGHPGGNHPSLTMNAKSAGPCQASEKTLGRGDVIGLGRVYR
jgi:hypothetical protein